MTIYYKLRLIFAIFCEMNILETCTAFWVSWDGLKFALNCIESHLYIYMLKYIYTYYILTLQVLYIYNTDN